MDTIKDYLLYNLNSTTLTDYKVSTIIRAIHLVFFGVLNNTLAFPVTPGNSGIEKVFWHVLNKAKNMCFFHLATQWNRSLITPTQTTPEATKMKPLARDTYIAKAADLQNKIAKLQLLVHDYFGHNPDEIHWSHVGDHERVKELLNQILNVNAK